EKVRILVYSRRYDEALNLMKVILEFYPKKYFDGPLDILSAIVNNKHITSVSSVLFDIKYSQWALAWHELIVTYSKDGHSWDGPFEKYKNNKTTSPAHDTLQPDTNTRRGALPKGY
ncbi:MAG: hypothetical protein KGI05_09475, partial [Thaumarchaeota archaeon]|nr:hypothetical protein [Nitrososphaerota archaeon]